MSYLVNNRKLTLEQKMELLSSVGGDMKAFATAVQLNEGKPTLVVPGYETQKVRVSHAANIPSDVLFDNVDTFQDVVDSYQDMMGYCMDPYGYEPLGAPRAMPSDVRRCASHAEYVGAIATVLDWIPDVVPKDKFPDDGLKAMNGHIVAGINHHARKLTAQSKVLVLCAGDGEDVVRLSHHFPQNKITSHVDLVGVTRGKPLPQHVVECLESHRAVEWWLPQVPESWYYQYDLIICHQGVQHLVSDVAGEEAFRLVLSKLGPHGTFIGDKVDFPSLAHVTDVSRYGQSGSRVELLRVDHTQGIEGLMHVRVAGNVFYDPVLSDTRLLELCGPYVAALCPGKLISVPHKPWRNLRGEFLELPATVANVMHRAECSVITYIEIARQGSVYPPPIPSPSGCAPRPLVEWSPVVAIPAEVRSKLMYEYNHGREMTITDLPYVEVGGYVYGDKSNGVAGRCVVVNGRVFLTTDDHRAYRSCGCTYTEGMSVQLQVEVIDGPVGLTVIVNDVFSVGLYANSTQPFSVRWRAWLNFLEHHPELEGLLITKEWYSKPGLVCSDEVVGQPLVAPAGAIRNKVGSARYMKRVWTVDLREPDGTIAEYEIEGNGKVGKFVRCRPDKNYPNDRAVAIRAAMNAVTVDELDALLEPITDDARMDMERFLMHPHDGDYRGINLYWIFRTRYELWPTLDRRIHDNRRWYLETMMKRAVREYGSTKEQQVDFARTILVSADNPIEDVLDDAVLQAASAMRRR